MDELYETPRPRVTASMLSKFVGKYVTMMGTVEPSHISSDGNSFQLSVDGKTKVEVVMSTPLNELLDDVVEVTGRVDSKCTVHCIVYRKLSSSVPLSMEDYNEAVEMIHKFPNLYTYAS